MGIVKSQAIKNSVFNYLGQVIGYVNVIILFPILLTTEEFGLTRLLASISIIYAQLSSFGVQRVIIKFFPFFQTKEGADHNGFLPLMLFNVAIAFLVTSIGFWLIKDWLVANQDSELFKSFYIVIPLLTALTVTTWLFDSYLKSLLKTSFTSFLNNILLKLLWLGATLAYYYDLLSLEGFIWFYCSVHLVLILCMVVYLIYLGQLFLKPNFYYYKWRILRMIYRYGAFSILDNTNTALMNNVDKIMIGFLVMDDLKSVAVYAVANHLSGVVVIPSISMNRILTPLISKYWKSKQRAKVEKVYAQSTLINLILTGGLFVLVWVNINEILMLVDDNYSSGVYAILFLMLSRFVSLSFGLNGDILMVSKHYWFNTVSGIVLIGLMIVFNLIFIPTMGLVGAALGTFLARLFYNVIRFFFLLSKEQLNPFTTRNLVAFLVLLAGMIIGSSFELPAMHFAFSILIKSIVVSVVMFVPLFYFKIPEDLNQLVLDILARARKTLKF